MSSNVPPDPQPSIFADCEDEIARRIAEGYNPAEPYDDEYDEAIPSLDRFTLRDLMTQTFTKPYCVVEDLLPPGLALLASPPKYGKSWMALDLCLSVVREQPFLGHRTNMAHCLYLALEDSKARLQERAAKLLNGDPAPHGLEMAIHAGDLSSGLYQQLNEAFNNDPFLKLVVIDTLQKIRGGSKGREGAYQYDYREMGALKGLADAFNATILLVHHLNKGSDDSDPHNRINGTTGILGAADTSIVLTKSKRSDDTATMSVTGRDIESCELSIAFNKDCCRWEIAREASWEERYEGSPLLDAIRQLVKKDGWWKGTSTALMTEGRALTGFELASSPKRLAVTLLDDRFAEQLLENENIRLKVHSRGSGSKLYELERMGMPWQVA